MEGLHVGHDSGVETGSTSINSVRDHSSCEMSGLDSTGTYNFTGDISSEDEEKVTCEYSNTPPAADWSNLSNGRSRTHLHNDYTDHDNEDSSDLGIEDTYTNKYTNKCDEYSGRASGSKSTSSGKSTPKHKPMELVVSHSSQTLVLKTPSRTLSDEHDTFSPEEDLSFLRHEESAAMTPDDIMLDGAMLLLDDQNKKFDQSIQSIVSRSSTKEEKQRQNEEIVNLESSSISSETGSWESVFPARSNQEARDMCTTFLLNEQEFCSHDNRAGNLTKKSINWSTNSTPAKHCFIDASSLADDIDVFHNQPISWQATQNEPSSSIKPTSLKLTERVSSNPVNIIAVDKFENELDISESLEPKKPKRTIKRLDSNSSTSEGYSDDVDFFGQQDLNFHTQFEKCRISTKNSDTSDSPSQNTREESQNNLQLNTECKRLDVENVETHLVVQYRDDAQSLSSETHVSDFSEVQNELNTTFILNEEPHIDESANNESFENTKLNSELIILPDTPHNSIIEIQCPDIDKAVNKNLDSPLRLKKYSEASPIISGGASIEDFVPKNHGSPMVRRKIDSAPILSGGGSYIPEEKPKEIKKLDRIPNAAWVVDMSDCSSTSSLDSKINRSENPVRDSDSRKSSLGFFVDFSDVKIKNNSRGTSKSSSSDENKDHINDDKKSLEFFIDMSNNEPVVEKLEEPIGDKKNIFSMFIDFGEKAVKNMPDRLATSLQNQRSRIRSAIETNGVPNNSKIKNGMAKSLTGCKSELNTPKKSPSVIKSPVKSSETPNNEIIVVKNTVDINEPQKNGHFMYVPSEDMNINLRVKNKNKETTKRHSWNTNNTEIPTTRFHKRAMSVSENPSTLPEQIPKIGSTFSIDSSLSDFSKSGISSGSSSGYARMSDLNKKHRVDCKVNETYDKSSPGSQTEGILTDNSPNTDDDVTYQNDNEDVHIVVENNMGCIKEEKHTIGYVLNIDEKESEVIKSPVKDIKNTVAHTMETLQAKIERQKQLLATVTEASEMQDNNLTDSGKFVRLSDLDKPMPKLDLLNDKVMSNSTGSNRIYKLFANNLDNRNFMSRSIGNHTNLITSEENSRSLSRLFPHLSKGFSSSLPSGVNANIYSNRSPLEFDDFTSDISATSSLSSSLGKSAIDSAEDSLSKQPRRLGEDLLRMFLQEISPDVTLAVGGRRMRAHKCILRSRCQYFAAILAGGWVESAGNVIAMDGFSYDAVHFAMCHIYSGAATPPDGVSLHELASLADLLGLEGLKEVTAHALKATYCHMFHKPCAECITGVCHTLPLALSYGLDELYRRAMRWVCRHFLRVWPTRPFASLPGDIMDRARHQIIAHLNIENVLGTVLDCEQLLATLPSSRWASTVEVLTMSLLENAHIYIGEHYSSLLASNSFLSLGREMCWNISRLETTLSEAASNLTPDQACRSYQRITRLGEVVGGRGAPGGSPGGGEGEEIEWHRDFIRLVEHLSNLVESCLVKQGARAMRVASWTRLEPRLRRRVQERACLGGGGGGGASPPERRTARSVRSASSSRSQDLKQIRQVIHAHSTRASSQENHPKQIPTEPQKYNNQRKLEKNYLDKSNITRTSSGKNIPDKLQIRKNASNKNILNKNTDTIIKSNSDKNILRHLETKDKLVVKEIIEVKTKTKQNSTLRQRSHSEVISNNNKTLSNKSSPELKTLSARVAHAKPRYLEPRKRDLEPVNDKNKKKNLNVKNKLLLSSSEHSSRTPSPGQKMKPQNKKGESSNMSLDSLASHKLNSQHRTNMEMSTDSLTGSVNTSTQTLDTDNISVISSPLKIQDKETKKPATKISAVKKNMSTVIHNQKLTPKSSPKLQTTNQSSRIQKNTTSVQHKTNFKTLSRTLTSPTKSSAAKIVPLVVKKTRDVNTKNSVDKKKMAAVVTEPQPQLVMERSGTFVKELVAIE